MTIAIGGVDPPADIEAHMQDMIADHMALNENTKGYEIHLIEVAWDESTYEYKSALMHDMARKVLELSKKCGARKPARIDAIKMIEEEESIAKQTEDLLLKTDVKNSVDLSTMGANVLHKCATIGENLVKVAFPRKEQS